jgi:hypothetical protein
MEYEIGQLERMCSLVACSMFWY